MTAKPLIPRRYVVRDVRVVDTSTGFVVSICTHEQSALARARKLNRESRQEKVLRIGARP